MLNLEKLRAERRRVGGPCDECERRLPCFPYQGSWLCAKHFKTRLALHHSETPVVVIAGVMGQTGGAFWKKLNWLRHWTDRASFALVENDRDNFVRAFTNAMIAWEGI